MRWISRARERIDATRWCPNFVSVSCLYCNHRLRADRRQCRRVKGRRQSAHAFYSDLPSTSTNGKGFGRGQNSATNPQRRHSSVRRRFQRTSASAASSVRECATICFRMHRMHRNHELHAHIFVPDGCWTGMALSEDRRTRMTQVGNRVTLVAQPQMVDIYFSTTRIRSVGCFYLWKCGFQWGGEDYYFYRARSIKCLGLWACGHRLCEPFATCKRLHRTIL
jgi:hypothetical protein